MLFRSGFHIRAHVRANRPTYELRAGGRDIFSNPAAMDEFLSDLDAVFHCAGKNRGDELEVEATNIALSNLLLNGIQRSGCRPSIIYVNSTHVERDTGYGRGKRVADEALLSRGKHLGCRVSNFIFPNVYGEFGRPFHNSVVSTFCHQLSVGETPRVLVDAELELLHAQDVAAKMLGWLEGAEFDGAAGSYRMTGNSMKVSSLLNVLQGLHKAYAGEVVPDLRTPFVRGLFNTLRSYLFEQCRMVQLNQHTDERGALFEALRCESGGQSFVSSTRTGGVRGNHYHLGKFERFLVVQGEAEILLRRIFSENLVTLRVSGVVPSVVDIPTFHAHAIRNTGPTELTTIFWTNEFFDPKNSDTYRELVTR